MTSFIQTYKTEIIIFLGAFLVRMIFAVLVQVTAGSHGFISFSDAQYFYWQAALNLLHHGAFSVASGPPYYPDAYHTPLYPLFVAFLLFLHLPLFGVVSVQNILAALMCVLMYRLAIHLSDSRAIAIGAAGAAIIEPMSIYWSNMLMSDTLFALLMTASFYFLARRNTYLSFFALGLATLTRPIALYFFPFFIVMLGYQEFFAEKSARTNAWRRIVLSVLIFVATILPWSIHNKLVFNTWSLSSASWYELYVAPLPAFAQAQGISVPAANIPVTPNFQFARFNFEYDAFYKSAFLSIVSKEPIQFALFGSERIISSLFSNRYAYLVRFVIDAKVPGLFARLGSTFVDIILAIGEAAWVIVYVFALLGGMEQKLRPWWLFFMVLAAINIVLSGGINPDGSNMSRYSIAFYPFFFIFAGVGVRVLRNWWKGRRVT